MKNVVVVVVSFSAFVLFHAQSHAGNYIKLQYSSLSAEYESYSAEPRVAGLHLGGEVAPNYYLEAFYLAGLDEDEYFSTSYDFAGSFTANESYSLGLNRMFGVVLVAQHYEGRLGFYGKVGLATLKYKLLVDATVTGGNEPLIVHINEEEENSGVLLGVGVELKASYDLQYSLEYLLLPDVGVDGDDIKSTALSLGVKYEL